MVFNDKWEMLILSADDMKTGSSTLYFIDLKKNGSLITLHPFSGKIRAMELVKLAKITKKQTCLIALAFSAKKENRKISFFC